MAAARPKPGLTGRPPPKCGFTGGPQSGDPGVCHELSFLVSAVSLVGSAYGSVDEGRLSVREAGEVSVREAGEVGDARPEDVVSCLLSADTASSCPLKNVVSCLLSADTASSCPLKNVVSCLLSACDRSSPRNP